MKISTLETCLWSRCPDSSLQVNSVAINDDGSRCVFGTSDENNKGNFATYCCDGNGNLLWQAPISKQICYQGEFWNAISGDGNWVAVGGEYGRSKGFLRAYNRTGKTVLDIPFPSRVNQVSLSKDGKYLAACYEKTLAVYELDNSESSYSILGTYTSKKHVLNSCVINSTGTTIVASGVQYENTNGATSTTGIVLSFSVKEQKLETIGKCELPYGTMRVAITATGNYWAAALHNGNTVLIEASQPNTIKWKLAPEGFRLSLAYAVDITETDRGEVVVACGANTYNDDCAGVLYVIKAGSTPETDTPQIAWSAKIPRSVNPGVSLDRNARYVTATDGQPNDHSESESSGSFYLFDVKTGEGIWKYNTNLMNWPMMLASNGSSVFGGSDNGSVYYWKL